MYVGLEFYKVQAAIFGFWYTFSFYVQLWLFTPHFIANIYGTCFDLIRYLQLYKLDL
jgi:hypothetical protein